MRTPANSAEAALWDALRDRKLGGFKFRRQHSIGCYVVDYYCAEAQLVVELDGETHRGRDEQDLRRQEWLESRGLKVLQCPNHEFYEQQDEFLEMIWKGCRERSGRPLTPDPSPQRGEGSLASEGLV